MDKRTTYTTARIRAEDLASGDVALIGDTWVSVRDCHTWAEDHEFAEYARLPDLIRNIKAITGKDGGMDDGVYVAVVYLHTATSHARDHHAYNAKEPSFKVSALFMYDLVTIQVPVPKEV